MSTSIAFCPQCGTQNLNSAQFCGTCGTQLGSNPAVSQPAAAGSFHPATSGQVVVPSSSNTDWHEKAGLICGLLSIFICGGIASIPGLYFGWSSLTQAKASGKSTTLSYVAIGLSALGILLTFVGIGVFILITLIAGASSQPDMNFSSPNPYGL